MLRTAVTVFIFITVMLSVSLYMVLSANRILDRTMEVILTGYDPASEAPGKPLTPPRHDPISFYIK